MRQAVLAAAAAAGRALAPRPGVDRVRHARLDIAGLALGRPCGHLAVVVRGDRAAVRRKARDHTVLQQIREGEDCQASQESMGWLCFRSA